MKQVMHGSGMPGPLLFLLAIAGSAVLAWYAFFFRVNPDELGVVMRFGEFVRQEQPGLHFRLPYPIEEVLLPKVTRQNITEVGMRTNTSIRGSGAAARDLRAESQMLTGDENIVDIEFVITGVFVLARTPSPVNPALPSTCSTSRTRKAR